MTSGSARSGGGSGLPREAAEAMVAALKEAERAGGGYPDMEALARSAYDRLQFDFPALPPQEARALARACLGGGGGVGVGLPQGMAVTTTLLEGVSWLAQQEGAKSAPGSASRGVTAAGSGRAEAAEICPMQVVMGAVGVCDVAGLLEMPLDAALERLSSLNISLEGGAGAREGFPDGLSSGAGPVAPAGGIDAAEMDDDDTPYEDFLNSPGAGTLFAGAPAPLFESFRSGEEELIRKVGAIMEHVSFPAVSLDRAWEALRLGEHLIRALVLLVGHPQATALEDVAYRMADLMAQAAADDPKHMRCIEQALERLSAQAASDAGLRGRVKLSLLRAGLAGAKGKARRDGRAVFWRTVNGQLQFLADLLHDLLAIRSADGGPGAGKFAGGNAATARGVWAQDLLQVCTLLEFHALEAPGGHFVGRDLMQTGVLKSLALLFGAEGANPQAEPLRRALLFACASGVPIRNQRGQADLAAWCGRVPSFRRALEEPVFQAGQLGEGAGACGLHSAVWSELLGSEGPGERPHPLASWLADGVLAAQNAPGDYGALWVALSLLQGALRAAGGQKFWGDEVSSELLRAREAVKALPAPEGSGDAEEKWRHLRAQSLFALKELVGFELPGKAD